MKTVIREFGRSLTGVLIALAMFSLATECTVLSAGLVSQGTGQYAAISHPVFTAYMEEDFPSLADPPESLPCQVWIPQEELIRLSDDTADPGYCWYEVEEWTSQGAEAVLQEEEDERVSLYFPGPGLYQCRLRVYTSGGRSLPVQLTFLVNQEE